MKAIRYYPEAERDVEEGFKYYVERSPAAAGRFLAALDEAQRFILLEPLACPVVTTNLRKCVVKTYPYYLLYAIEADTIDIVAVAHGKRRPGFWLGRKL